MQQGSYFGPHEMIELHEVLAGELAVTYKMQQAAQNQQDQELKSYLETVLARKQRRISLLQSVAQQAVGGQSQQGGRS